MQTLALFFQGRRRKRDGAAKRASRRAELLLTLFFTAGFLILAARLVQLASVPNEISSLAAPIPTPTPSKYKENMDAERWIEHFETFALVHKQNTYS